MELIWYGTASLVLHENTTTIAFDPFCKLPVKGFHIPTGHLLYRSQFQQARHVFITHGHFDHIYHITRLYGELPTTVYCTKTPYRTLRKQGLSPRKLQEITPGFHGKFGPFSVSAYQGRHCHYDIPLIFKTILRPRLWLHLPHLLKLGCVNFSYPENQEILFYEVTCNGKRIQIMGSMNLDEQTEYPTGADILVMPLQGRSDQNTYALQFLERLKPKKVYIDHYDDAFPPLSDSIDCSGFIQNAEERFGIICVPMTEGEIIHL